MTRIDLVTPVFEAGAIGFHTMALRDVLRRAGHESSIYGGEVRADLLHEAHLLSDRGPGHDSDVIVYQVAIGNDVGDLVHAMKGRLVLNHHNITPSAFFEPWDVHVAAGLRRGELQLANLATHAVGTIADSEFNAQECRAAGCENVSVAPVLLSPDLGEPDGPTLARLNATKGTRWLFVGRLTPHKAQHDIVTAFAAYRRSFDSDAQLVLVGGATPERYGDAVRRHAERLEVADAVEIASVPQAELAAHYRAADVFVCLSEHEGFCVPVLESWHSELPILALERTAIPETVGGAGLLLPSKESPLFVAAAAHRLVADRALRDRLTTAGRERLERAFSRSVAEQAYVDGLGSLIAA